MAVELVSVSGSLDLCNRHHLRDTFEPASRPDQFLYCSDQGAYQVRKLNLCKSHWSVYYSGHDQLHISRIDRQLNHTDYQLS